MQHFGIETLHIFCPSWWQSKEVLECFIMLPICSHFLSPFTGPQTQVRRQKRHSSSQSLQRRRRNKIYPVPRPRVSMWRHYCNWYCEVFVSSSFCKVYHCVNDIHYVYEVLGSRDYSPVSQWMNYRCYCCCNAFWEGHVLLRWRESGSYRTSIYTVQKER